MEGCICEGNWRKIIKESEPLISKRFIDKQSKQWIFVGVLWAEDDFYYIFSNMGGIHRYLTCCASLEQHGMRVI